MNRVTRQPVSLGAALGASVAVIALLGGCATPAAPAATNTASPSPTASPVSGSNSTAPERTSKDVVVNGVSIHTECSGPTDSGKPTVMLITGAMNPLTAMTDLQDEIAKDTRVCSYDRPGTGDLPAPEQTQTLQDAAALLHSVTAEIVTSDSITLAGHSSGGMIAAQYAADYPDQVASVVLIDATPARAITEIPTLIPETEPADEAAGASRAEILSMTSGENPERMILTGDPLASIGDIPLTVIRHGLDLFAEIPTYGPQLDEIWVAGQEDWLALSTRSNMIVAETSGHYIYDDQLDLVVDAVVAALG
ncbi:alpha/beta fold hydrolase [Lysinibacter cavernae]|uniref:Pimeloyl-ACP methyl ester carboxylesterase n=1 Tax=Lysinibacter cavernae TaxID=1640652 RepID=A0A7X5TT12_9MICO|nr:alpha/beta hydrolase [Lysinibacter cavernae]NIH53650.1 pimeloyl-ACP methyl ester carboxylesterase [Lysinibacter cavernae]